MYLFDAVMQYKNVIRFQKFLYFNTYLSTIWMFVTIILLYLKIRFLDSLTGYLTVTVFTLFICIECARLYLGNYGNISNRVPELAGFLMLTALMQLPLLSYFLFNPHLKNTPTEMTLHILLWNVSLLELPLGYFALRNASMDAESMYLSRLSNR